MPDPLVLTVASLLFVAAAGVLSIGLARMTRVHPAWGFLLCGAALPYFLPFTLPQHSLLVQLAEVGALFLVFLAALDIEWDQRFGITPKSVVFAFMSQAISVVPLALLLQLLLGERWLTSLSAALIVAVHAPGKRQNPAGETFRSNQVGGKHAFAALFSEVSALLALALLLTFSRKTAVTSEFLQLIVGLVLLIVVLLSVVPQALRILLRRVGEESYALFYLVIALALGVILAIRAAGIEPILGAYAAGFVISRFITQGSRILGRLRFLGLSILVPCFYMYFGLSGLLFQDLRLLGLLQIMGLTLAVVILRLSLSALFSKGGEIRFTWLHSLHRNPIVLVIVYFATARGLLPPGTAQLILWHFLLSEIVAAVLLKGREQAGAPEPHGVPRVLLPLSNPETMLPLMNLATHLGELRHPPKLYPLNIVPDDANAEVRIRAVESRFNEIIPMYAAREQPVELTARIENDRIRAVTHAARELLCDRILLGLGAVPTLSRPQGYSFLENLAVAAADRLVVAAHLSADLSVTGMVNVIVAHARLLESQENWFKILFVLAHRLRAELTIFGDSEVLAAIKTRLETTGEKRLCHFRAGHIHAGLDLLTLDANPHALTVAVLARAPFFPEEKIHARLPEMMLRAFADRNFVLLYPPMAAGTLHTRPRTGWKKVKRWLGF
ncbi:MAG: cation:proton antiporter [Turneriella sp.]